MLKLAFGYLAIAIVVAIGFSSMPGSERSERRVVAAATKHGAVRERRQANQDADLEYVVEVGPGGHYLVEAMVNGEPVDFLVDTGASDIVLTMGDAERLGLQPATLRFTQRFATANGEVRGAPVVLREIRIGQFSQFDVPASVNEAPLRISLLGMSFLERLNGYEVRDGRLVLRW